MTVDERVIFITGTSSGLGLELAREGLRQGLRVAGSARRFESIADLVEIAGDRFLPLKCDVTRCCDISAAIAETKRTFGRIDVLINNAGYALMGALEETTQEQIERQFAVNVFGLINVTRAVLPTMRQQKSGAIVNISSVAGLAGGPGISMYSASKHAVEGLSESLSIEVKPFGIRVMLVEPGGFQTRFRQSAEIASPLPDYDGPLAGLRALSSGSAPSPEGDPKKAACAILEALNDKPPLHLVLGTAALKTARAKLERMMREFDRWKHVSENVGISNTETALNAELSSAANVQDG